MDSIVAYSERESMDPITGADGILRKEWRVRPIAELAPDVLADAFGADWRRHSPGAEWILEKRYIRRGTDEGWKPFQTLNRRSDAWRYIDSPSVPVDPEMIEWAAALQRRREEQAMIDARAREERAAIELKSQLQRLSRTAWDKLRTGKDSRWTVAWDNYVKAHFGDDEYKAKCEADDAFMAAYRLAVDTTTVPSKRKAIRLFLQTYGPEFLPRGK